MMWYGRVWLRKSIIAACVVDLPDPVGQVKRTRTCRQARRDRKSDVKGVLSGIQTCVLPIYALGESGSVDPNLPLVDDRHLMAMHVLDRVFDRDDVVRPGLVEEVDHRRLRRRLA